MSEHIEANSKRLGELITDGYKAIGESRRSTAKLLGVSDRTLYSLEVGERAPRGATQRKLEEVLGWGRGSIGDVLGLGPDADLSKLNLEWMKATKRSSWASLKPTPGEALVKQLGSVTADVTLLLRDKDAQIEHLQHRIHELEQQVALLQGGYDLAADGSPNRGRALRDHFDSVEQENQDTA